MTRTTTKALSLLSLALLGSCQLLLPGLRGPEYVRVELKPEDRVASAGPRPSSEAAKAIADLYLQKGLKDYDSAKIQWGSDVKLATWFESDPTERDPNIHRQVEVAGWDYFANVNAKNGFGAYAGWQSWRFRFRQDRLAAAETVSAAPPR
ncbi:MAG: hypothetical protein U1E73_01870 [Planctomycetota bacterium]